ncbi:MAG: cytochrome c biogenesis protein CcsA [Bacillota bacterium]
MSTRNKTLHQAAGAITFLLMTISIYMIFIYAPMEKVMMEVQKIFYFHVGVAWNGALAFLVVFVVSIMYLMTKDGKWDRYGMASAEIGLLFATLVLLTGPIWGKSAWNTWWTWEPRLTSTLVIWFIYVAYFLVRGAVAEYHRKATLSAVFGIIGFLNVPIVYYSVHLWRVAHPMVFGSTGGGLHPKMLHALIVTVFAFTFLYIYYMLKSLAIETSRRELENIKSVLRERID